MAATPQRITDIEVATPTKVPVDWLALDRENPRHFGADSDFRDDASIIEFLYRSQDLAELIQSIAANGYLDIEPLIVLADNAALIVLEGNRRLSAIQLIRDEGLVQEMARRGVSIKVPVISAEFRETLEQVTVYRVATREDARSFIGFKHINGAARWDSYAKAKFAARWYRDGGATLDRIAEHVGDRHDTIKRMVHAIYVLEQADKTEKFSLSDRTTRRFNFSHLYTALSRSQYREYLGLPAAWASYDPRPDPVSEEKLNDLGRVLIWIYGSKSDNVAPVIRSQNPDIKRLGEVLASAEGQSILAAGGSLEEAHAETQPASQKLAEALILARKHIRESSNNLRGFDGRDHALLNMAEDISEQANAVHAGMKSKAAKVAAESTGEHPDSQ